MKVFKKKISKKKFYREYVDILNGELQLYYREADVFAVLLQINAEWGSMAKEMDNILSTDIRRVLMRETRITKSNLVRYISSLVKKEVLIPTEKGGLKINELFIPEIVGKSCYVTFVLELE